MDPAAGATFDSLSEALAGQFRGRHCVIAIDGFGCCGKSTLAQSLAQRLSAVVLETDDFHLPRTASAEPGSPLAYRRWGVLQQAVDRLAAGAAARYQPIDWETHELRHCIELQPQPILIIDGIGASVLDLRDPFRIFVDGRAATRMARVAARDGAQHADWDHYVFIERSYFERWRPWQTADLWVLGAELTFSNSAQSFSRRLDSQSGAARLDVPATDPGA